MRIISSIVFLFAQQFWNVFSHPDDPQNHDFDFLTSGSDLSSDTSSGCNPCDKNKIKHGEADAHLACHNECLGLQEEISGIFNMNSNNRIVNYFNDNCGMVTQGKCTTGFVFSTCWCHSPDALKGERRTLFSFCRHGVKILRKFTSWQTTANNISAESMDKQTRSEETDEVKMHKWRRKSRRSPRPQSESRKRPSPPESLAPSSDPDFPIPTTPDRSESSQARSQFSSSKRLRTTSGPLKDSQRSVARGMNSSFLSTPSFSSKLGREDFNTKPDNIPEGNTLWTYVRVNGHVIRAVVDTGSAVNLINPKYKGKVVSSNKERIGGANGQTISVEGLTTIDIEMREGVFISVTGLVATMKKADIFFGSPFFDTYKAKIRIQERIMQLTDDNGPVMMRVRYQSARSQINIMEAEHGRYTSLRVYSIVNGKPKIMIVDTGASKTVVSPELADLQTARQDSTRMTVGNTLTTALAKSDIRIGLGGNPPLATVIQEALVPDYYPAHRLVAGNDFIRQYVQVFDYDKKKVFFRFSDPKLEYVPFASKMYIQKLQ